MDLDSLIKGFGLTQNILTIILLLIILFYVLTINKNLSLMELFSLGGQGASELFSRDSSSAPNGGAREGAHRTKILKK